jgi:hypothetical protein
MKLIVVGIATTGLLFGVSYAQTTTTNPNTATTPTDNPTLTSRQKVPAEVPPKSGVPGTASTTPVANSDDKAAASGNANQAVATTNANASEPAKGANSFTMGEAKSRLEKTGFADVSDLKKDDDGVWRGTGKKGGAATSVWLDYKGNTGSTSN